MSRNPVDLRSKARSYTQLSLTTLVSVMTNPNAMSSAKVAASREMLNRGWGAPKEPDDEGGNKIIINILKMAIGNSEPQTIDGNVVVQRLTNGHAE